MAALSTAALGARPAAAAGWVKDPGHAYVKAAVGTFRSGESMKGAGLRYQDVSLRLYGEVGLVEGLHAVVDAAWIDAANVGDGVTYTHRGPGDLTGGLRLRLAAEPVAAALGLDAKVPGYGPVSEQDGYERAPGAFPDLGDGQVDVTARAEVGWSLHPAPGWLSAWAGYRHRRGAYLDTALLTVDGGWRILNRFGLGLGADGALALGDDAHTQSWLGLRAATWVEVGGGVAVELLGIVTPWARNSESGLSAMVGVSWQR